MKQISEEFIQNDTKYAVYQCTCGRKLTLPVVYMRYRLQTKCEKCRPLPSNGQNKWDTQGRVAIGYLSETDCFLIDFADYQKVSRFLWFADGDGVYTNWRHHRIALSHFLLDFPIGGVTTIANPFDFRRENLQKKHVKTVTPGQVFGRYSVLTKPYLRDRGPRQVRYTTVKCACGTVKDVTVSSLLSGAATQCKACANKNRRHTQQISQEGEIGIYKLSRGRQFTFDWADHELFEKHIWFISAGTIYCKAGPATRLLTGKNRIRFKDGNPFNLRRDNLVVRDEPRQNGCIPGICLDRRVQSFVVSKTVKGQVLWRKRFKTIDEAVLGQVSLCNKYLGEDSPFWGYTKEQLQDLVIKARLCPEYQNQADKNQVLGV